MTCSLKTAIPDAGEWRKAALGHLRTSALGPARARGPPHAPQRVKGALSLQRQKPPNFGCSLEHWPQRPSWLRIRVWVCSVGLPGTPLAPVQASPRSCSQSSRWDRRSADPVILKDRATELTNRRDEGVRRRGEQAPASCTVECRHLQGLTTQASPSTLSPSFH